MFYNKLNLNDYEPLTYQNGQIFDNLKPDFIIEKNILGRKISVLVTKSENNFGGIFLKPKSSNSLNNNHNKTNKLDEKNNGRTIGIKTNTRKNNSDENTSSTIVSATKSIGIKNSETLGKKRKKVDITKKVDVAIEKNSTKNNIVIQSKTEDIGIKTNKKSSEKEKYNVLELKKCDSNKPSELKLETIKLSEQEFAEVAMAKQDASKDTSKSNKKVVKKVKKIDKKNKQSDIFNKSFNINSLESPAKESNLKTNFKNKDVNSKKSYYDTFNNSNKTTNNNTTLNNEAIAKKYEQVILNNRSTTHSFYESTNKECASAAEKLDYNIVYSQRDTGSVNSSCKKSDLNSVPDSGNINSFDKYKQRANLDIPTDENNENDIYKKYKENNFNTKILTPNKDNPSNNVVNIKKCDISLSKATKSKDLSKGNCSPVKISKKDELDIMFGRQSNKKQKSSKKIVSQSSENTDSVKEVNYALEKSNPVKLFSNNLILKNSVFNSNNVSDSNVNHINCSFDVYQSLHKYDVVSELKSDYKVSDYLLKEEVKVATNITNIKDFKVSKYLKPTDNFDLKEVALDYSYDTNKKNVKNTKVSFITNIKNKIEKAIKFISSIFKHDKSNHKIE